jgi:hypothetical protein
LERNAIGYQHTAEFLIKGQRHTSHIKGYMVEGAIDVLPVEMQSPIPIVNEHTIVLMHYMAR